MRRSKVRTSPSSSWLAAAIALGPALAEATGSVSGVSASPSPAVAGAEVTITLAGSGTCATYVTFGDNQKSARLTQLPATVKHIYAAPGRYVIRSLSYRSGNEAPGLSPCSGLADMELVVNPSAASKALPPVRSGGTSKTNEETRFGLSFRKIEVATPSGKTLAKDDWQSTGQSPSPTPTSTPAAVRAKSAN